MSGRDRDDFRIAFVAGLAQGIDGMKRTQVIAMVGVAILAAAAGSYGTLRWAGQYENAEALRQAHYEAAMQQTVTFSDGTVFELKDVTQSGEHLRIGALIKAPSDEAGEGRLGIELSLKDEGHSMFLYNGPGKALELSDSRYLWEGTVARLTANNILNLEVTYRASSGNEEVVELEIPNPQIHYSLHRMEQTFDAGWLAEEGYRKGSTTLYQEKDVAAR